MNTNLSKLMGPVSILFSLAATLTAAAAEPPTVDAILAKLVEATGGKPALEKVHSRVIQVRLESEAIGNSQGEVYSTAPNKMRSHLEMKDGGALDEGFDGVVGWAKTPWQPLRVKEGEELAMVKRSAEFYRELKLKSLYPGLAYKRTEKVGEEDAYLLEWSSSGSSKERFWLNAQTGLMARQESEFASPQGVVNVNVFPSDYKAFDGIKYPGAMKMKVSAGGQTFEFTMKFLDVKHNLAIEPAKFAKPSE